MSTRITSDFKITVWDSHPYDEPEQGAKLLRVEVKKVFHGAIEAESTAELLMCQADEGSGYVATERVIGRVGDRSGSFVIQHGGALAGEQITDVFGYVVSGSGTGELKGISGKCTWFHEGNVATFTLDYEFA